MLTTGPTGKAFAQVFGASEVPGATTQSTSTRGPAVLLQERAVAGADERDTATGDRARDLAGKRSATSPVPANPLPRWRTWVSRACLALALLAGTMLGARALHEPGQRSPRAPSVAPATKKIKDIRVGDRVWADNPELEEARHRLPDPDPKGWRHLKLVLTKEDGRRVGIELLRPVRWLVEQRAAVGGRVRLDLPEMGCEGEALVLSIGSCPSFARGRGRVVTGTYTHEAADNVLDLHIEGLSVPLGVTSKHPIWSVDRKAFVPAGDLKSGERVRPVAGGFVRVLFAAPRAGLHTVYNIEVDVEHVYHVSALGIVVHNTSADIRAQIASINHQLQSGTLHPRTAAAARAEVLRLQAQLGAPRTYPFEQRGITYSSETTRGANGETIIEHRISQNGGKAEPFGLSTISRDGVLTHAFDVPKPLRRLGISERAYAQAETSGFRSLETSFNHGPDSVNFNKFMEVYNPASNNAVEALLQTPAGRVASGRYGLRPDPNTIRITTTNGNVTNVTARWVR
jgi:hypothetical protein